MKAFNSIMTSFQMGATISTQVYIILFLLAVCAVLFFIAGWKLTRGKWLRLIAGNTFLGNDELATKTQRANAKYVGKAMYAAGVLTVSLGVYGYLESNESPYTFLGIVFLFVSVCLTIGAVVRILKCCKRIV